jgi:hypothetical protein
MMDYGVIVRINTDIFLGENQIVGAKLKEINIERQPAPGQKSGS